MFPLEQGRDMRPSAPTDLSGGADSGVFFGATMLVVIGVFQVIQGLAAIMNDEFFAETHDYTFQVDVTVWGWLHLALGILLIVGGVSLFRGSRMAGIFATVLAGLGAIANFVFLPYFPFWALLIILLNIWVIWSIATSGILSKR